jgi:DNA polymerase (family 10)
MKNAEVAQQFNQIADLMEILGENTFRIISYRRAAHVIETMAQDIDDVSRQGKLTDVAGIGESTAAKVQEYLTTGKITRLEELKGSCPSGLTDLMRLPGLGPKTAMKLWKECGIDSLDALRLVVEREPGRLLGMKGMGAKKVQAICDSIAAVASAQGRLRLADAAALAEAMLAHVRNIEGVERAEAAGSLRRGRDSVGDIDLLCQAPAKLGRRIVDEFTRYRGVVRVLAAGETKGSVLLTKGAQADLRVVEASSFGAALAYFTGSKDHNVRLRERAMQRGWKLNEYALLDGSRRIAGADEAGIYQALGLALIPPELREDRGEIQAAERGELPELLEPGDMRGDLHMHTTASDGLNSIDEMIQAARTRGYRYIAITDHSQGQHQAGGLHEPELLEHLAEIRRAAERHKDIVVLASCEVDIKKDGSLDYPDKVLAQLDMVVASPHAALALGRREATQRLLRAAQHPRVNVIAHPTGRIVNGRPGMDVDIEELAAVAGANKVALEVNADPARLDLSDTAVRAAIGAGAKIAISSDAHSVGGLEVMKYGVTTARRGWATRKDVINAWSERELLAFIRKS